MQDWKHKLQQAKEMLDLGFMTQEEFDSLRKEALRSMGLSTGGSKPPSDELSGKTVMGTSLSATPDELSGKTSFVSPPSNTQNEVQQGSLVGQYKVLDTIGEGGMGKVYRARHTLDAFAQQTGDVAIKVMHSHYAKDDIYRQRFIKEAGIGRNLIHRNIVRIFDIVSEDGVLALVMDFVKGKSLQQCISSEGMPAEQALPILEQLSGALDAMHAQGIVHRDLKPENIVLRPDGTPIILDMGIAKVSDTGGGSATRTGMSMGTPIYMPPEQVDAKNVTSAADRYSLGLIAYQLLSGRLPWPADAGQGAIISFKFTNRYEALTTDNDRLNAVLVKMLNSDPTKRYSSCAEFVQELRTAATNQSDEQLELLLDNVRRQTRHKRVTAVEQLIDYVTANPTASSSAMHRVGTGKDKHNSIESAVKASEKNDVIVIEPGLYEGDVIPENSPVILIGLCDNNGEPPKVQCKNENLSGPYDNNATVWFGLQLQAENNSQFSIGKIVEMLHCRFLSVGLCFEKDGGGFIYQCTFNHCSTAISSDMSSKSIDIERNQFHNNHTAIAIQKGLVVHNDMRDCSGLAVEITNKANPTIKDNKIHDGKDAGILVYNEGLGVIENNDIYANTKSGIEIQSKANPTIKNNKIHDGKQAGIFVLNEGLGVIENNDIFNNEKSNIIIQERSNPTIKNNKIHNGKDAGIFALNEGLGIIEGNDIFNNELSGIIIQNKANPTIKNNKIHAGKSSGISVYEEGLGVIANNDIFNNEKSNIIIQERSNPTIKNNKIHNGKDAGIFALNEGLGIIEGNDIFNNELSGIIIQNKANPTIKNNNIHDAKEAGIFVLNEGLGTIEENDIYNNEKSGILIQERSNPTIKNNKIHDGKDAGIFVYNEGLGTIERNDIYNNASPGIQVESKANPTIIKNRIHHGIQEGIWIKNNGLGTVINNDIFQNKLPGIAISNSSNPIIKSNRIYEGLRSGIFIYDNGLGTIENNDIYENVLPGIQIKNKANPVIRNNSIYQGKNTGIFINESGLGTIEGNDIFQHATSGITITTKANPIITNNQIHEGNDAGIYIYEEGLGIIESNTIYNNQYNGILIDRRGNPTVRNNSIQRNQGAGVCARDEALGTFEGNKFSGNSEGEWNISSDSNITRKKKSWWQ
jgi:parallel beta-helix repeat protein